MEISRALEDDALQISEIMLKDLSVANLKFPKNMIEKLKIRASVNSLKNELKNPNLILLCIKESKKIKGFIVGYKKRHVLYLDYVCGESKTIKMKLIIELEKICKKESIRTIETEAYEFMENDKLYKEMGYIFKKRDKANNLIINWYGKII